MLFGVLALAATLVFIRLGLWQIGRLHERQARNAAVAAQIRGAPLPFDALPWDTADAHYRPVVLDGRFDYAGELVIASRSHHGSPGVELLTPLLRDGHDSVVLVNRGWVYSPDGGTVDRARWREGDSVRVTGFVETYAPDAGATRSATDPRIVRRVSRQEVAAKLAAPVTPYYVVMTGAQLTPAQPVRRELPSLDEGSHRSYAIQWFFFAAIALGGATAVVLREREERREHEEGGTPEEGDRRPARPDGPQPGADTRSPGAG